jgi:hypothetical protein
MKYDIGSFLKRRKGELKSWLRVKSGSAVSTCQGLGDLRWIRDEGKFHRDDENEGWINGIVVRIRISTYSHSNNLEVSVVVDC